MPEQRRNRTIATVIAVVAIVTLASVYAWKWITPRETSFEGTLVSVNATSRIGTLRIVHPKSGQSIDIRGELDPNCEVRIADRPASVNDLAAGDRIRADGKLYRWGAVVATRVTVLSSAPVADKADNPTASQPAEAPTR